MALTIAIIAAGAMGSAVAQRLVDHGVIVRTSLEGRSPASAKRAAAAGMIAASDDRALLDGAAALLSIVPPGEARALAHRFRATLSALEAKPVYVELNAVNPATVTEIAAIIAAARCPFIGGSIIGGPPKPGEAGPRFYIAGPDSARLAMLTEHGLDIRPLEGGIGAAAALKMSYAGLTKGLTALGAAMILAAAESGAGPALARELAASQPNMLAYLRRSIPAMYGKSYRWVAEMREIAGFVPPETGASAIYEGAARLYEHIAVDAMTPKDKGALAAFETFLADRVE